MSAPVQGCITAREEGCATIPTLPEANIVVNKTPNKIMMCFKSASLISELRNDTRRDGMNAMSTVAVVFLDINVTVTFKVTALFYRNTEFRVFWSNSI